MQGLRIGFGVLALWLAGVAAAAAQPADSLRQVLVDALARGDAARLLEQAPSQVELALLGKGQLYSRMQARYVLMDFFQAYPPLRVELDEDRLLEPHRFLVGRYWYARAAVPFQVYMRLHRESGTWKLHELRVTAGRPRR
ncbi:DUF4783 domain-containing protein [Rhodothermus marinus]|uniref:DUF4783 domain-containing protein n=1 Tax=Rhodothermus marinus TaxID=29549 RepID=UPI0026EB5693|nr:DUF4783 domain-containing protein [Rhodothermus marinus]